jgi:hypothetical protein
MKEVAERGAAGWRGFNGECGEGAPVMSRCIDSPIGKNHLAPGWVRLNLFVTPKQAETHIYTSPN